MSKSLREKVYNQIHCKWSYLFAEDFQENKDTESKYTVDFTDKSHVFASTNSNITVFTKSIIEISI